MSFLIEKNDSNHVCVYVCVRVSRYEDSARIDLSNIQSVWKPKYIYLYYVDWRLFLRI